MDARQFEWLLCESQINVCYSDRPDPRPNRAILTEKCIPIGQQVLSSRHLYRHVCHSAKQLATISQAHLSRLQWRALHCCSIRDWNRVHFHYLEADWVSQSNTINTKLYGVALSAVSSGNQFSTFFPSLLSLFLFKDM